VLLIDVEMQARLLNNVRRKMFKAGPGLLLSVYGWVAQNFDEQDPLTKVITTFGTRTGLFYAVGNRISTIEQLVFWGSTLDPIMAGMLA
jgi:hypothetical protein